MNVERVELAENLAAELKGYQDTVFAHEKAMADSDGSMYGYTGYEDVERDARRFAEALDACFEAHLKDREASK